MPHRIAIAISCAAAIAGLAIVLVSMGGAPAGFPLDDAWIHMVYARALAHGRPFEFTPGETASGATSPLWVALLALAHLAFARASVGALVHAVQAIGAVAHVAGALLGAEVAWRGTRSGIASSAAGTLIGLSPALACASLSGMEVAPTAAALLGALALSWRGRPLATGCALGLAIALRPESAVVAVVLGTISVARGRGRDAAIATIPVVGACATIAAANLAASGRPLPATFYLKQEASLAELLPRLATLVLDLLPRLPPLTGCIALVGIAGVLLAPPRQRLLASTPAIAALAWIVASAITLAPRDPAAFYHQRYLLPVLPLLVVALAIASHHAAPRRARRLRSIPALAVLALGIVTTAIAAPSIARHHESDVRNVDEVQRAMGEWLAEHTPADARIGASDVGAIRYFSDRAVVDLMGLNTPGIVWSPETFVSAHPVTHVAYMPSWLRPTRRDALEEVRAFETERYTVTSSPEMARQVIEVCRTRGRVPFAGLRRPVVLCTPPPD